MVGLLIAAGVAGLLGSVHCIGMCGAFAASCTRIPRGLPAWHLGRIGTYAALGGLAGAFGRALPGPPWVPAAVATVLLLWFTLALAGLVPEPRLIPARFATAGARAASRPSVAAQFLFGVANGLLPCGLVYSALGLAVGGGSAAAGALAMLAFGLGTLPSLTLAALGIRRVLLARLWQRRLMAFLVLTTGLWTIWTRSGLGAGHAHQVVVPRQAEQ